MVFLNKVTDVAIYDSMGKRVMVRQNTQEVDVSDLAPGYYFVQNTEGDVLKLVIQ